MKPSSSLRPDRTTPDPIFNLKRWKRSRNAGTRSSSLRLFPLRDFLQGYQRSDATADLRAGFNVALLDFPQGMAYAVIAGLPFAFGIYASAVAAFLGPILASSRFVMLGPTNAIAVLTLSAFLGLGLEGEAVLQAMPLLLLLVAMFMIIGALVGVAGLINFVSRTVVTGYITAAAFLIVIKQCKHALGLDLPRTATFFDSLLTTLTHLPETHPSALLVTIATIILFVFLRRYTPRLPAVAICLLVMALVSQFLIRRWGWDIPPLSEVALTPGIWPLSFPKFNFHLLSQLIQPALAIAFLSLLESASIAKTLAAKAGDTINVNQQMLSMGLANAGCAFLSGMPISGSLTRSSLNQSSGARTPVASMFGAAFLATGILLLGPALRYIPMPALSALIITVGVSLINPRNLRIALGTTRSDAIVFLITFISGLLLPLDTAIYVGVITSVLLFMRKAGTPRLVEFAFQESGREQAKADDRPALSLLHVDGDLFFGSADIFLEQARSITADPSLKIIILRLRNAHNLDATCAMAIEQLVRFARERDCHVLVCGAHPEVLEVFRNSGLLAYLGAENVFCEDPDNPNRSHSEALKRARSLVGKDLNVRLFVKDEPEAEADQNF